MTSGEAKVEEGTITFWTQPNKVSFSDDSVIIFTQLDISNGSILILKDKDKKIKFFHVFLGRGRTDVEVDVSTLNDSIKHFFAFSWSVVQKENIIYIDGERKASAKINY